MNSETENILRQDSLYESEKMLGNKHWSEFNEIEQGLSMLKFFDDNQKKKDHLESIGDTYWGIKWDTFINLIETNGFKTALRYDFEYNGFSKPSIEEAILYYHPQKGLIIWAESFGGKDHINGGKLYGEVYMKEEMWQDITKVLTSSHGSFAYWDKESNIDVYKEQVYFNFDIREGLIHNINKVEEVIPFAPVWKDTQFLWFVDYVEDKVPGYDYKEITQQKISRCPKEFQDIIGINNYR